MLTLAVGIRAATLAGFLVTLSYGFVGLLVLGMFREELFAERASSTLLVFGVILSVAMLLTDSYGVGPLTTLEFPSQVLAVAFLLAVQVTRRREIPVDVGVLPSDAGVRGLHATGGLALDARNS